MIAVPRATASTPNGDGAATAPIGGTATSVGHAVIGRIGAHAVIATTTVVGSTVVGTVGVGTHGTNRRPQT